MINIPDWISGFPGAVTVSDRAHTVVYMNEVAAETWASRGGKALEGTSLLDCHGPRARKIIEELLATGGSNVYTVEKQGVKKLIHQSAWRNSDGEVAGLIEMSLVLPPDLPHFKRD